MKNILQKLFLVSCFFSLSFSFSGCAFIDGILQKKDDIQTQYQEIKHNTIESIEDVQNKIEETKKNIEEKKAEFDQKVQEIQDAKAAFDKIFQEQEVKEDMSPEEAEKLKLLEKEIEILEKDKNEISTEITQEEEQIKENMDIELWLIKNDYNKSTDVIKKSETTNEVVIYREVSRKAF